MTPKLHAVNADQAAETTGLPSSDPHAKLGLFVAETRLETRRERLDPVRRIEPGRLPGPPSRRRRYWVRSALSVDLECKHKVIVNNALNQ